MAEAAVWSSVVVSVEVERERGGAFIPGSSLRYSRWTDLRSNKRSAETGAYFEVSTSGKGWARVARMARISVRSRSLKRSVARRIPLNHAA